MAREQTSGDGRGGRARRRAEGGRPARPRRMGYIIGALVVLLVALAGGAYYVSARSNAPAVATTASAQPNVRPGTAIDGISCQAEIVDYHIHSALILYDHGRRVMVPANVGIPVNKAIPNPYYCLYSLHTHEFDHTAGIVHIESPTRQTYALGQFFDIWHYTSLWDSEGKLGYNVDASFVDALRRARPGDIHAYVDGKPVRSYRDITFTAHKVITLEIGAPLKPPTARVAFPQGE